MIKKKHGRIALIVFLVFIMSFGSVLVAFGSPGRSGERGNAGPPAFAGDAGAEAEAEAEDTGTEVDEPAVEADLEGDTEADEQGGSEVEAEAEAGEEANKEEEGEVEADEGGDPEVGTETEDGEEADTKEEGEVEADEETASEVAVDSEDGEEVDTEDAEELDADEQGDTKADVEGEVDADEEAAPEVAADSEDGEEVDTEDAEEAAFATFSTLLTSFIGLTSNTVTYSEDWDGRGMDSEDCTVPATDDPRYPFYETGEGWIHWVFSTKGDSTDAELVLDGTGSGTYAPGPPLTAEVWHFYTPYFELDGLTATIYLYGGEPHLGGGLVISDYCPGGEEDLDVSKTVFNSYIRTHDWSIEKRVETDEEDVYNGYPKIWLDGPSDYTETATWYVDVTYEGYEDSDFLVYGEITIENTGDLPAVIVDVVDELCGEEIDVVWPDGFEAGDTLAVGQTIVLAYSVNVDAMLEDCDNVVTVTTERDEYTADAPVPEWGDPAEDHHAEVDVLDDSEFLDNALLATLDAYDYEAGDVIPFDYDEDFAWEDYKDFCGQGFTYVNTAEVIGDDDEVLDSADATLKVNIRCEDLTVTKDVVTYFEREHFWDIDKKVETELGYELDDVAKIWLYTDGSGDETATWTVDVTYEGYEDSDWNISGTITIENTGQLDAVITSIVDELCGEEIDIIWVDEFGEPLDPQPEFPYTLAVGETLKGIYSEDVYCEGDNEVTVTTERDEYFADAAIVWGNPDEVINETVNIKDISDLFGEVDLGTVTAPNGDQFTYTKDFAWADYGSDNCGSYQYDNTATIVETGQSADATLKVNVQCVYDESAWAKGDPNVPFCDYFANWGWTNPIEPGTYEWDLWAGAAQCDTSKGTLVGSVTVVYDGDGYVTVTFNVDAPYTLESTAVYADYDMFPKLRNGRDTIAPGQYYNASPFDGSEVYVIAHAVVGMPDPNFGP